MRLSRKGRFAVTAMMNLALSDNHGPKTLTELTHDQGISLSYLEQIFARLRKAGLVSGVRGPGGGYCLARPADDITVAEIITAIDEKVPVRDPAMLATLFHTDRSPIHAMWNDLSTQIYDYLNHMTLADSVERYHAELARQRAQTGEQHREKAA